MASRSGQEILSTVQSGAPRWARFLALTELFYGRSIVVAQPELARSLERAGCRNCETVENLQQLGFGWLTERDILFVPSSWLTEPDLFREPCMLVGIGDETALADATTTLQEVLGFENELRVLLAKIQGTREGLTSHAPDDRPALFLDRDGTIIDHIPYLDRPDEVRLRPEIVPGILKANECNWGVVCVTNQSGIGKAMYSWRDYNDVQQRMHRDLVKDGVFINHDFCAPFFFETSELHWLRAPAFRKPRPGMLVTAALRWGYTLKNSIMVGDSLVDLQAGTLAGAKHVVYVGKKKTDIDDFHTWSKIWRGPKPEVHFDRDGKILPSLIT